MRYWSKTRFGFSLLGLTLLLTAAVLLMCSPSHLYEKLTLFVGGFLMSVTAMTLQVRVWHRRQDVYEE